jgi:hypothetical protein
MSFEVADTVLRLVELVGSVTQGDALALLVESACDDCPGAENTLVAAAWANIAYMTHSALLYYINFTGFGVWAPLLYMIGAIGALVAVALNSPPRNYTWFILGPAIYGFLVGSTQDVRGVDWVVAGYPQDMQEVWRDAETGMGNSPLLQIDDYSDIVVNKTDRPSKKYPVAMPMLFFDELFSATSSMLVKWTGLYSQLGDGGAKSNLAPAQNLAGDTAQGSGKAGEGPWYLMSNLKAPMVENITNVHIRNPQLRDAFITFLASECGDAFKAGVNAGAYNAASMARGSKIPKTIMIDPPDGGSNDFEKRTGALKAGDYSKARAAINRISMPAPRSLQKLLSEPSDTAGSFGRFSGAFAGSPSQMKQAVQGEIICSPYLWILIQGLRHEMGHAYWQLIRSAPRGFNSDETVLYTLFYGWDIRKSGDSEYASPMEMIDFTQMLIFTYLLRNEMQFAPQITATEQKFAPSEQTIGYSNAYVGSVGAKTKSSELYNWAVMMPHIQGILLYVIIVGYPFAAMAMIIPGYWKGFFTWVTFFAWIKLWDVGFAVVQVLERSVWAMMGNHSNMARVANMLIQTGEAAGGVEVRCEGAGAANGGDVLDRCAVPLVESRDAKSDQPENEAFFLLDKALLLGAAVDLDVSNGYYLYIMAALYFAVPAVTGQLVLGAKSGLGGLLTNSLGEGARDISGASKSGLQAEKTNMISAAKEAISQAALAKGYRSPTNKFLESLNASNEALNRNRQAAANGAITGALDNAAKAASQTANSFDKQLSAMQGVGNAIGEGLGWRAGHRHAIGGAPGMEGRDSNKSPGMRTVGSALNAVGGLGSNMLHQSAYGVNANQLAKSTALNWDSFGAKETATGLSSYQRNLAEQASFDAETVRAEALTSWSNHAAGMAGVYGANNGSLAPSKPTSSTGMAMQGMLGAPAYQAAQYSGNSFIDGVGRMQSQGHRYHGSNYVNSHWRPATVDSVIGDSLKATVRSGPEVAEGAARAGKVGVDYLLSTAKPPTPK